MSTTAQGRTFGQKLQAEFDARSRNGRRYGARTLARELSTRHGGTIENHRRAVIRWLRGATPELENRAKVEDALGVPRDSLKGDDEDDEEADPLMTAAVALYSDLLGALRAEVRREIERTKEIA